MAVTYGFFNSVNGDRKYNAEQMSEYFRGIINEGVYQHLDGGLAVTAGTGLAVNVAAGRAIIQNRWVQNSAAMSLTIAAASETYARKDAVVIRLNWSSRAISIAVKTGTPAASPVAPSMTRNATTYEMALAYVNVAANATSVTVTDKRSDSTVCGWVTVAQSTSGEVDAMLNDMKTGFDGVVYSSPAAMVQGCDQKLQDEITSLNNAVFQKSFTLTKGDTVGYYDGSAVVPSSSFTCIHITDKYDVLSFEILTAAATQVYTVDKFGTVTQYKLVNTYIVDLSDVVEVWLNFFGSTYCAGFTFTKIIPVDKKFMNSEISSKFSPDYITLTEGENRGYYNGSNIVDSSAFRYTHIVNPTEYTKLDFTIETATGSQVYVAYKNGTVGEYRNVGTYSVNLNGATDIWLNFFGSTYSHGFTLTPKIKEMSESIEFVKNNKITYTNGPLLGYYSGSAVSYSSAFKCMHITDVSDYAYLDFEILTAAATQVYVVRNSGTVTELRVVGKYAINLSDVSQLWLNFFGATYCAGFTLTRKKTKKVVTVGSTGCDYTNVVQAVKNNQYNTIFKLSGETFDVEAQYKAVYGNDYFDNYTGMYTSDVMDRGIYLGLGCEMIGTPKTVLDFSNYDGANNTVTHEFSIVATSSDNVVKDITFKSNGNCRYHIHDDIYIALGTTNLFENLVFKGTTVSSGNPYYGAGMGIDNSQILRNCYFTEADQRAVGIHNNAGTGKNTFILEGCYCAGYVFVFHYGTSIEKSLCMLHGNAWRGLEIRFVDQETYPNENMEVVQWNNETLSA